MCILMDYNICYEDLDSTTLSKVFINKKIQVPLARIKFMTCVACSTGMSSGLFKTISDHI